MSGAWASYWVNSNIKIKWIIQQFLKVAIDEKYPELTNTDGVVFHQNNARHPVTLQTQQELVHLGRDVLLHPPYSPDLSPLHCHLFWTLQNSLNVKNFNSLEAYQNHLGSSPRCQVLGRWNHDVVSKTVKGSGTKWQIKTNWINLGTNI